MLLFVPTKLSCRHNDPTMYLLKLVSAIKIAQNLQMSLTLVTIVLEFNAVCTGVLAQLALAFSGNYQYNNEF